MTDSCGCDFDLGEVCDDCYGVRQDALKDRLLAESPAIWISDFLALARDYYEKNPTGGSCHVWLDEGNFERDHVEWTLQYARKEADCRAILLAQLGLLMTDAEREALSRRPVSLAPLDGGAQ